MPLKSQPIFDSMRIPCKGMRSAITPSMLPPGYFSQLTNVRFDRGNLYMRDGLLALRGALASALAFQGAWHGYLNAVETVIAAYDFSGYTALFSLNLSTYAWTEITAASGRNGNTRMTEGNYCVFAAIATPVIGDPPSHSDLLIIQNGVDHPRVYDPAQPTQPVAINAPINLPAPNSAWCDMSFQGGFLTLQPYNSVSSTNWGVVNSSSNFELTGSTGLYGTTYFPNTLTVNSAVSGSPTITMTTTGGLDTISSLLQLGIVCYGASSPSFEPLLAWDQIKVAIHDETTSADVTVWDPSAQTGTAPAYVTNVDPNNAGIYMVAFTMPSNFTLLSGVNNAKTIVLTYVGAAPATTYTLEILGFSVTQWASNVPDSLQGIQGTTQFGYSWFNSQSRGESAGSVISNYVTTTGSTFTGAANATWSIPNSPLLLFEASILVPNVTSADISAGVDDVYVYYAPPGAVSPQITSVESQFVFLGRQSINTYSGSWPTSNAGKMEVVSIPFSPYGWDRDPGLTMPDGYAKTIPIGMSMLTSGAFLVVGGVGSNQNQVWYSWSSLFTRFESQVQFLQQGIPNDLSATINQYTGEVVTAVTKVGGIYTGIDPVIVFTNAGVYRTDTINIRARSQHTKLGKHGMPFSRSYTESENILYWTDSEREIMMMQPGGVPELISKKRVDDKFVGANLTNSPFLILHNRLFVAYQPVTKSANTNMLVYETWSALNEWCEDIPAGGIVAQGLLQINRFTGRIGWVFDNTGGIYQLEAPGQTTDNGSTYVGLFTSPRYMIGWRNWLECGPVVLVSDSVDAVLTVTRTWQNLDPDTVANDGTLNLVAAPTDFSWIQESSEPGAPTYGGRGMSVQVTVQGNLPGGFNFYACSVDIGDSGSTGFSSNL